MRRLGPVLLIAGCSGAPTPAAETLNDDVTSTSSSGSTSTSTRPPSVTTSTANPTGDEQTSSDGFLETPDGGGIGFECSVWNQDCPLGEKCAPWANDGGSVPNATRCVAVSPNPDQAGEPCTPGPNGVSGIDSCDIGSLCWNTDRETGMGHCIPHCTGSVNAPNCADPMRECSLLGDGALNLCTLWCDPLDPTSCRRDEACYPVDNRFVCAPDESGEGGAAWEGCEFLNSCEPGLVCVNPQLSALCPPDADGCCLPVCDTSEPQCPLTMDCAPWFEPGNSHPRYDNVGICLDELPLN